MKRHFRLLSEMLLLARGLPVPASLSVAAPFGSK